MRKIKFLIMAPLLLFALSVSSCQLKSDKNEGKILEDKVPIKGFAVVELFTSEGCSSCPSADRVLTNLANTYKDGVIVLGFHVDYWNRLGWKDKFSKADFSNRQRAYASVFGSNRIYTPQSIVNGSSEFIGSNETKIKKEIEKDLSVSSNKNIQLTAKKSGNGNSIHIDYNFNAAKNEILCIALLQKEAVNAIKSGENQGKKLAHINIVRVFKTVNNSAGSLEIDLPDMLMPKDCKLVAYVQQKEDMKIIAGTNYIEIQ